MGKFICDKCGATREGRCKPKQCLSCGESNTMKKEEKASCCSCSCSS